jgi:hypothetical protein
VFVRTYILLGLGGLLVVCAGCCGGEFCSKRYEVRYIGGAEVRVDGRLDERVWEEAYCERGFCFPWEGRVGGVTEFRSFFDDERLYFSFRVEDGDIVVAETVESEQALDVEDRVEMFLARDGKLEEYFCFEVDALGRLHDYRGSYYRQFDSSWDCGGIQTAGVIGESGYTVEAAISAASLEGLGFDFLRRWGVVRAGLFRADFVRGAGGEAEVHWVSWVRPGTAGPDFHVPSAFGCLRAVR